MATVPFPITGTTTDDIRPQVYELIRDLYENKIGGADLGDVFSLPGEVLTLVLSTPGGLTKSGNKLGVQVTSDGGLQINSNGLLIKVVSTGGLETNASGLGIKLDGPSLSLSAAGLKATAGLDYTIINYSDDKVLTNNDFYKIHVMDVSAGIRTFWLPDITSGHIGAWITLGRRGTTNSLKLYAAGTNKILNSNAGSYIDCNDTHFDYSTIELFVIANGQWSTKSMGVWNSY